MSEFEPISGSLPHIYVSMLPLACHRSDVASHYSRSISPAMKVVIFRGFLQSALPNTSKGHTDVITSVAYSPNGKYIVSSSYDDSVIVWSAESGELVAGPFKRPLRGCQLCCIFARWQAHCLGLIR